VNYIRELGQLKKQTFGIGGNFPIWSSCLIEFRAQPPQGEEAHEHS